MLLSAAGIPGLRVFIGKFYILTAGVAFESPIACIMLVVNSAIGLFYS